MKIPRTISTTGLILAIAFLLGACGGGGGSDSTPIPPANPSVTTTTATSVGLDNATLRGTVNPNGDNTISWFEVGPTSRR
jgi:hypothetical protein